MTIDAILQLARAIAVKHGLPQEIVCGMIERESTDSEWAVRYEPGFLARYVMPQYNAGKLDITETYTRSMSWGVLQIMGEVAREFGFTGKYLSELCDPAIGIEFACRKLDDCLKRHNGDMSAALESFNGGSNANYAAEVLSLSVPYRTSPIPQSA
jgi:Transglycosylase SLT domain